MSFPSLVMLEPSVFRRDDEDSFPDDTKAPIKASAATSWGARFSIALDIAEPPSISRLYAQLPEPGFLPPKLFSPLGFVATHRHLALFRVSTEMPDYSRVQNFFIYRAYKNPASPSLKALPPCTQPYFDHSRRDKRLPRRAPTSEPRLLPDHTMGLWCRGKHDDEFVVAELKLFKASESRVFADICFLRSSWTSDDDHQLGGTWHSKRVEIMLCRDDSPYQVAMAGMEDMMCKGTERPNYCLDDAWLLYCWKTDTIIPCDRWLCLIDYNRGILFCDLSSKDKEPTPTVSFLRFPLHDFPSSSMCSHTSSFLYRGVSVVDDGCGLKFIDVARDDGVACGPLQPGASFTITCHSMELSSSGSIGYWKPMADYKVASCELWNDSYPGSLPRDILMYPQVDIDRPSVVHFLLSDFAGLFNKKMWVVSIDMSKKVVDAWSPYINGTDEGLQTADADWIKEKSLNPTRFLPCEFPKFLDSSSKRKRMG